MVGPAVHRAWVAWVQEAYQVSRRRACRATGSSRSVVNYKSRRPDATPLRLRLRELAAVRVSYGHRRLHVLLRREGWRVNHKKTHRLYREEGLQLRRARGPKRRKQPGARGRPVRAVAEQPNVRWAMDFVHDQTAQGTAFRVLTVVDVYTRECKALVARRRFHGEDVAAVLTDLIAHEGRPGTIQCDQGAEFTSLAMDAWAYWQHIPLDFGRRGTPGDNAVNEAFNGSLRRECLSQHHFLSLADAQQILATWRDEYNNERPHSSLQDLPPARFRAAGVNHADRVVLHS
jgi:putative transposase